MIWGAVMLAGALGAVCRFLVDLAVTGAGARLPGGGRWPLGTVVVNATGSLAAGSVAGLAATGLLPADGELVVGGGFLGAYTTFSTVMVQTVRLLESGARASALGSLLLPMVVSCAAALLGWILVT